MARELVVLLWGSVVLYGGPVAAGQAKRSKCHSDIAEFAPEFSPTVAHDPILALAGIISPADNGDDVIDTTITVDNDAGFIVEERISCNATCNGATIVDFLLHGTCATDRTVISNADVGVVAQSSAGSTFTTETATSTGNIQSIALGVHVPTESLRGITGACQVWLRCLNAHAAVSLDPLVGATTTSTIARSCVATIEDMLDRRVDVNGVGSALDLQAISQGRDRSVGPARSTILRDVLISAHGAEILSILVAPGELFWVTTFRLRQEIVGIGEISIWHQASGKFLLSSPDFTAATDIGRCHGQQGE